MLIFSNPGVPEKLLSKADQKYKRQAELGSGQSAAADAGAATANCDAIMLGNTGDQDEEKEPEKGSNDEREERHPPLASND